MPSRPTPKVTRPYAHHTDIHPTRSSDHEPASIHQERCSRGCEKEKEGRYGEEKLSKLIVSPEDPEKNTHESSTRDSFVAFNAFSVAFISLKFLLKHFIAVPRKKSNIKNVKYYSYGLQCGGADRLQVTIRGEPL